MNLDKKKLLVIAGLVIVFLLIGLFVLMGSSPDNPEYPIEDTATTEPPHEDNFEDLLVIPDWEPNIPSIENTLPDITIDIGGMPETPSSDIEVDLNAPVERPDEYYYPSETDNSQNTPPPNPTATPVPTEKPENIIVATDKPSETKKPEKTVEPAKKPERTSQPNADQDTTAKPTAAPEKTNQPESTKKPETTEKPAATENPGDSPTTTPDITVPTLQPTKPPEGSVEVPGFGPVEDGGDNVGEDSDSDGDIDKPVGTM